MHHGNDPHPLTSTRSTRPRVCFESLLGMCLLTVGLLRSTRSAEATAKPNATTATYTAASTTIVVKIRLITTTTGNTGTAITTAGTSTANAALTLTTGQTCHRP